MLPDVKTETSTDLRCAVRFPLHLSVALHERGGCKGETQDISAGGVLIR